MTMDKMNMELKEAAKPYRGKAWGGGPPCWLMNRIYHAKVDLRRDDGGQVTPVTNSGNEHGSARKRREQERSKTRGDMESPRAGTSPGSQ